MNLAYPDARWLEGVGSELLIKLQNAGWTHVQISTYRSDDSFWHIVLKALAPDGGGPVLDQPVTYPAGTRINAILQDAKKAVGE